MANIVPQAAQNNRGVWAKSVEKATRHYVERSAGEIYVLTGPAYKHPVRTLGPGKVWIPTTYSSWFTTRTQREPGPIGWKTRMRPESARSFLTPSW